MANTYTQLHVQLVFAVKYRASLIQQEWKEEMHKYMTTLFQKENNKMLQINSVADHTHILIGLRPVQSLSSLVQHVKSETSTWIKKERLCKSRFAWQEGFGGFTYSKSQIQGVIRYIQNQEAHHKKENFLDEYRRFLKAFEIEYDEKYIFKGLV